MDGSICLTPKEHKRLLKIVRGADQVRRAMALEAVPGRFNLLTYRGGTIVVDYGHNVAAAGEGDRTASRTKMAIHSNLREAVPGYAPSPRPRARLIVVEGPNDVIALNAMGVPAVAVCSNTETTEQAQKLAVLARDLGRNAVSVMFDLDREGENGAKQAVVELAARCPVRLAWTTQFAGGMFKGRQPESLTNKELESSFQLIWGTLPGKQHS